MSESSPETNGVVVDVSGLGRVFKRKVALSAVDITVPRGCVFGLVGENGAGKTTFIKHLLGVYKAKTGSVRVFGLDPVQHPVDVLGRIGYLSEDRDIPGWMRVREMIWYTQAFYPAWDEAYAEALREQFNLPPDAKVKHLSRGEKAKAGLLIALAYRPELLLLDEPSSGLDAAARRDILAAIVRTVADEGRTVIFSSHLLDEVERVADVVAMLHEGSVLFQGPMEDIKARYHQFLLAFGTPQKELPPVIGAITGRRSGDEWSVMCCGDAEEIRASIAHLNGRILDESTPSLEEVFLAHVARPYNSGE